MTRAAAEKTYRTALDAVTELDAMRTELHYAFGHTALPAGGYVRYCTDVPCPALLAASQACVDADAKQRANDT
jgi:hypothetical protein